MIFRIHRAHSILEAPKARYEKTMQTHKIIYIIIMHVYLIYVHLYSIHVYICIQLRNARKIQMVPCLGSFSCVSSKKHGISFNLSVSQSDCYHIAAAMLHRTNKTAEATSVAGLPGCSDFSDIVSLKCWQNGKTSRTFLQSLQGRSLQVT